jgi:hypothetical protein
MLFYQLNIIHDIIHDYGFYAAENRWLKNTANIRQFMPDRLTIDIHAPNNGHDDEKNEVDDDDDDEGKMDYSSGARSKRKTEGNLYTKKLQISIKKQENKNKLIKYIILYNV